MKKLLLSSAFISSAFATQQNYFEIGTISIKTDNNFSTLQKKNISSFDYSSTEDKTLPYFEFYYSKNLTNSHNLYLKSIEKDLNIGNKFSSNLGEFDIGLKLDLLNEEWANPFIINTNKEETKTKEFGAYLAYTLLSNKEYKSVLKYQISEKSYDKDSVQSELKRDGIRNILALNNIFYSSLLQKPIAYINNISLENYNAKGKASSYNKINFEVGLSSVINKNLELTVLTNIAKKDFDDINPIFNKSINENIYGIKTILKYNEPFKYQNTYISLKMGLEKKDTNEKFYDAKTSFAIVSLAYKF